AWAVSDVPGRSPRRRGDGGCRPERARRRLGRGRGVAGRNGWTPAPRLTIGCGMSEARLLGLVMRHPHPAALARRVRNGSLFAALRHLEDRGLVTRRRGLYRLTRRGQYELWMARAVARLVTRAQSRNLQ